ncbi:MAG: hypothetical protein OXG64_07155 [Chloroflexi bacterium]|nr:hypothetical protein [Chloroflexota bacterium]
MSTINVFLGGSGKYVAEELKGLRTHYELPLPEFIAFDLSREDTHTGAFALGHDLLAPDEQFAVTATNVVAPAWESLGAGTGLDPQTQLPGPTTRPEAAIMSRTAREMRSMGPPAEGLWGLRAAGLLAFAAFMDPASTGPEAEAARRFKTRVQDALRTAGRDGQRITVNIVASTAGGTGAGFFLPFTLWLADHSDVTSIETNLVLITSSAFDNEPLDVGVNQREMRSKGRTGTFAIIRELELLYEADLRTAFPFRRFPIPTGNATDDLRYRLGSRPFHRVYWMGRRARDGEARKADVYRETEPLVRILSNTDAVNDLDGQSGTFPQRLLPSVVTIDYPRLARARRLSSRLATAALRRLTEGEERPKLGRRFFAYAGDDAKPFGKFLQANEDRAFARDKGGQTTIGERAMNSFIEPFTRVPDYRLDYAGIETGTKRTRAGYATPDDADWEAYCASLATELKQRWTQHEERIDQFVRQQMRAEADRFRNFVTGMATEYLNPDDAARGPYPLSALRTQAKELKDDLALVETFFGHGRGVQGRISGGITDKPKYLAMEGISQLIARQESALQRPAPPRAPGGLTPGRWALLLFVTLFFAFWTSFFAFAFAGDQGLLWGAVIGALVTAALMHRRLRRPSVASLAKRREREERQLFGLYRDRVFAHTSQALLRAINEIFVPRAKEVVETLDSRAAELGEVYEELLDHAQARASEVHTRPRHSVAEIGRDLSEPEIHAPEFLEALTCRVRVQPQTSDDGRLRDLRFRIGTADGSPATGRVREMAADIRERRRHAQGEQLGAASRGGLDLTAIDAAIDSAATTALALHLPQDFEDALRKEAGDGYLAALDEHLAALVHLTPGGTPLQGQDRRRPAVDCSETDATVKRLYVPSVEVQGYVVRCVSDGDGGELAPTVREELLEYMGPDQRPLIVQELGASIALLSLWVPDVGRYPWSPTSIMDTHEGQRAHDTYYGVASGAQAPGFIDASERNFHILPEISAAAAIETSEVPYTPLRPCVTARLLGSHPHEEGPTILELFYLLRVHEVIQEQFGTGPVNRRNDWEIRWDGGSIALIEQPALVGASGASSGFGPGQRVVNAFDAFQEFMLLEGPLATGLIKEEHRVVEFSGETQLPTDQWSKVAGPDLANLQRAFVARWWEVESRDTADREFEAMLALLRKDLDVMDQAPAAKDWQRAVESVLRSGNEQRRALATAAR